MLIEPLENSRAPQVSIAAKFSIPFCTALALQVGKVGLDDFEPARLADPAILRLAQKVTHSLVPDGSWSMGAGAGLVITLEDGRQLSATQDNALGNPAKPLSDAQLVEKFVECAGRGQVPLDEDRARGLAAAVMALEECEDVGAIFRW